MRRGATLLQMFHVKHFLILITEPPDSLKGGIISQCSDSHLRHLSETLFDILVPITELYRLYRSLNTVSILTVEVKQTMIKL